MANWKKSGNRSVQQPEGSVRASQVVTTYGPGALVDLVHDAVIIKEMSKWRYGKPDQHPSHLVMEPRLESSLKHRLDWYNPKAGAGFYKPPVSDDDPSPMLGVTSSRFPRKFVCTNCRAIVGVEAFDKKNSKHQFLHDCNIGNKKSGKQKPVCVPVRFVAACENGHMQDFPWFFFVHQGEHSCDSRYPSLKLQEGPTGDFSDATVECQQCDATRRLSEARADKGGMKLPCFGKRPWISNSRADEEECDKDLHLVVRTASNTWFSAVESAVSIPEAKSRLEQKLEEFEGSFGAKADANFAPMLKQWQGGEPFSDYSLDEIQAGIAQYRAAESNSASKVEIREAEHRTFMKVAAGEPLMDIADGAPVNEAKFVARLHTDPADLPAGVSRIVKVEKLREVRVLIGFSRLRSPARSLQGQFDDEGTRIVPACEDGYSLPAAEIRGEGIFIELDPERLDEWAQRPAVRKREQQLIDGFEKAGEFATTGEFPGIRFYLLHTLAHALIQELALECGYAASALRERLYCKPANVGGYAMNGLLISTGTPGSEGTLGGLVAQAEKLRHRFASAFEAATICSNDPVCSAHDPRTDQSDNALDGAACHGCLYVSESSCEWFNKQLDRALLVPTMNQPAELAYFDPRRDLR